MNQDKMLQALRWAEEARSDYRKKRTEGTISCLLCARAQLLEASEPLTDSLIQMRERDAIRGLLLRAEDKIRNFDRLTAEIESDGEGPARLEHQILGDLNLAALWIKRALPERFDSYGFERSNVPSQGRPGLGGLPVPRSFDCQQCGAPSDRPCDDCRAEAETERLDERRSSDARWE